jgi:N-acylneuraminate cytidylyltransferase
VIKGKKILAVIPVRGGSKAVAKKNIREVAGKPLLIWSAEEARKSKYIDRMIISTDDDETTAVAQKYGCEVPFKRPEELATDEARTIDVVLHAIENAGEEYDYVVLLQATSPLRTVQDIDSCISMCVERNVPSVVSMTEVEKSPYWMFSLDENNKIYPLLDSDKRPTRRQDADKLYQLNGAVYVNEVKSLIQHKQFIMKKTLSYVMTIETSIDIDTELDLTVLEHLMLSSVTNEQKD